MTWHRVLELGASIATLAGMAIGSTTLAGAGCYAVGQIFWWWLTFDRKLWGLMPLNIASTAVIAWNLVDHQM